MAGSLQTCKRHNHNKLYSYTFKTTIRWILVEIKGESNGKRTYSVSLCHLSTFYLSYKEVWKPCGMTWHFVIRLIVFPAGSSPSNLPHTQHFTTAPRPFVIFWIYGSVRTGHQRGKRIHLQDNGNIENKPKAIEELQKANTLTISAHCVFHC